MAIQNEPSRITIPFAASGTKNTIPDNQPSPSASQAASWTDGFPAQCSLPLSAGGIPPARADFNGIFNAITQSERFTQEGGVWTWDATVDYAANRVVLGSDGLLYWSIAQSGPNLGGAQDPTLDTAQTYWASPKVPTMPAGDDSQAVATTGFVGAAINIAIPVGTVLWSANPAVPSGYLPCNGAAVLISDYPFLYNAIGNTFLPEGVSASPATFNLPNLIGKVPWGSSTQIGTEIEAGLPNTEGTIVIDLPGGIPPFENSGHGALFNNYSAKSYTPYMGGGESVTRSSDNVLRFSASRSNSIYGKSSTVQPPALCLLPCIRYE